MPLLRCFGTGWSLLCAVLSVVELSKGGKGQWQVVVVVVVVEGLEEAAMLVIHVFFL